MAARAGAVLSAVAACARGVASAGASHSAAGFPSMARWAAGLLPAVAARAARPAGPVRAAQAVTAPSARPKP
jgi:hypothetical protein